MSKTNSSPAAAPSEAKSETTSAPMPEKRKTPLEMVRERQANMQAARRGGGNKGAKVSEGGGAHGTDSVSKPVQITRKTGG